MKYGYVKVATCTPDLKVADVEFNTKSVIEQIQLAKDKGVELLCFPELSLTGVTCGDLFFSDVLLNSVKDGLKKIVNATKDIKMLVLVGLPFKNKNLIYNVAVAVSCGEVLGIVPKTAIYNYGELSDGRYFSKPTENGTVNFDGKEIPFGTDLIFKDKSMPNFVVGVEIGADLFAPLSPSQNYALNGANIIVNLCAKPATVGNSEYIKSTVTACSSKLVCGYVLSNAGKGESTTDMAFGGYNVISENGRVLRESELFSNGLTVSEIDVDFLSSERSKIFNGINANSSLRTVEFDADTKGERLTRIYEKTPFVPTEEKVLGQRAELILDIQSEGLRKRIEHARAKTAVLGLSGGLDSTLAILVAVTAMKKLNRPLKDVVAVTMPCFGTTSRTFQNTIKLAKALGVTLKKVDITKAVERHLKDIKHDRNVYDVTFENAQARERTQVIMDISNMTGGLVVGTGDLSEVALGWATYNGDHMSMYGVNCTVPKTLVRHVVKEYAEKSKGKLKAVLTDILDTPVSPELLPAENDDIAQKTEDIVGPYVLHDFFLYNMIRRGYSPEKLYFVAKYTFNGDFKDETILKWLKIFVRRFFVQQFKRSCVPDGIKVGTVGLSPRGDWKMPSDAVSSEWLKELEIL